MIEQQISSKKLPPRVCKQFPNEFSWARQKTASSLIGYRLHSFDQNYGHQAMRQIVQSSYSLIHPQQHFFNSNQEEAETGSLRKLSLANLAQTSHRNPQLQMYFSPQINSIPSQQQLEELRSFYLSPQINRNTLNDEDKLSTKISSSQTPLFLNSEFHNNQHEQGIDHQEKSTRNKNNQNNFHDEQNQIITRGVDSIDKQIIPMPRTDIRSPSQKNRDSLIKKLQSSLKTIESIDQNTLPQIGSRIEKLSQQLQQPSTNQMSSFYQQNKLENDMQSNFIHSSDPNQNFTQIGSVNTIRKQQTTSQINTNQSLIPQQQQQHHQINSNQQRRYLEETQENIIRQQNSPSNLPQRKINGQSQQSQPQLKYFISQQTPLVLSKLANQIKNNPSSTPSTRHGSPSSWTQSLHSESHHLVSDQIIESDLHSNSRILARNKSLVTLPSQSLFKLKLPNIIGDLVQSTNNSCQKLTQKQQIGPAFSFMPQTTCSYGNSIDFENGTEMPLQQNSSRQIREVKTPSFNYRQTKYPADKELCSPQEFGKTSYVGPISISSTLQKSVQDETYLNSSRGTPIDNISTRVSICHHDSDLNSSFGQKPETLESTIGLQIDRSSPQSVYLPLKTNLDNVKEQKQQRNLLAQKRIFQKSERKESENTNRYLNFINNVWNINTCFNSPQQSEQVIMPSSQTIRTVQSTRTILPRSISKLILSSQIADEISLKESIKQQQQQKYQFLPKSKKRYAQLSSGDQINIEKPNQTEIQHIKSSQSPQNNQPFYFNSVIMRKDDILNSTQFEDSSIPVSKPTIQRDRRQKTQGEVSKFQEAK